MALVAVVLVVVGWVYGAEPIRIEAASMEPTLSEGDQVIVDKLSLRFDSPGRGDLIVFRLPGSDGLGVKRVVGVAGEEIATEDGGLVVDHRPVTEPYIDREGLRGSYFGPVIVPPGAVFVMGDNRRSSVDSRSFGAVPLDAVVGRVRWRVWPPFAPLG